MTKDEEYWNAKRDEIYKGLCAQHITGELAWWLANLEIRTARLEEIIQP